MGYTEKLGGVPPFGTLSPAVVTGAGVLAYRFLANAPVMLEQIAVVVTTAIVSTGSVVLTIKKRPLVGSASGESTIGVLTIPAANFAAGQVLYKNLTNKVHLAPGQEIAFDVTTAAAGGGAAGAVLPIVDASHDPEFVGNESSMVASA